MVINSNTKRCLFYWKRESAPDLYGLFPLGSQTRKITFNAHISNFSFKNMTEFLNCSVNLCIIRYELSLVFKLSKTIQGVEFEKSEFVVMLKFFLSPWVSDDVKLALSKKNLRMLIYRIRISVKKLTIKDFLMIGTWFLIFVYGPRHYCGFPILH